MVTDERQRAIDELVRAWDAGQEDEAKAALLEIIKMLWGVNKPLLTTTEAAEVLGIRSVNTLKALLRIENVPTMKHGNRTMIPVSELVRLRSSERVRNLRAVDRLHDEIADLGTDQGMTSEQLTTLNTARPGSLPWKQ